MDGATVLRVWDNLLVSSSPYGPMLSVISLLAVFTPISALQLLCTNSTDDIR